MAFVRHQVREVLRVARGDIERRVARDKAEEEELTEGRERERCVDPAQRPSLLGAAGWAPGRVKEGRRATVLQIIPNSYKKGATRAAAGKNLFLNAAV